MELIAIFLAIALGVGGLYSQRERKADTSVAVVEAPEYRPNLWIGEDHDTHIKDFLRIGPVIRIGYTVPPLPDDEACVYGGAANAYLPAMTEMVAMVTSITSERIGPLWRRKWRRAEDEEWLAKQSAGDPIAYPTFEELTASCETEAQPSPYLGFDKV